MSNAQAWVKSQAQGPHASLFFTAIWGIWRWRNNEVLGDNDWTMVSTVNWIITEHRDYDLLLTRGLSLSMVDDAPLRWAPPVSGEYKMNSDGAFKHDDDRMGMGGIVRDAHGAWISGFYAGSLGGDALRAEIAALKHGLTLLWNANVRRATCEVDCLDIVEALENDRYQFHALASELLDIRLLLDRDWTVTLAYVPREANAAADCLAGLGASLLCPLTCLESPPQELQPILARDLLAL